MGNSLYPNGIDIYSEKIDNVDIVYAAHINDPQQAIVNIETELGINPSGGSSTVADRLSSSIGLTGAIIQKLTNKYGSPVGSFKVVVTDTTTIDSFTLTTVRGDHRIVGVIEEGAEIPTDGVGRIVCLGKSKVYLDVTAGKIYKGDLLVASSNPGYAEKLVENFDSYPSEGILGIALEDCTVTSSSDATTKECYILSNQSLNFGSFSRETRRVDSVVSGTFRIYDTNIVAEYFQNKKLVVLADGLVTTTAVSSAWYDGTYTNVTCTSGFTSGVQRVFYQSVDPRDVGVIDASNSSNVSLSEHLSDTSIHRAQFPFLLVDDLSGYVDGVNVTFPTTNRFDTDAVQVFSGGALLYPSTDYTLVDNGYVVTTVAPSSGTPFVVSYIKQGLTNTMKFHDDLSSQVTGSNSDFYTTVPFVANTMMLYRGGLLTRPNEDYVYLDTESIRFITNSDPSSAYYPSPGSIIECHYERVLQGTTNTINLKYQGDAVVETSVDGRIMACSGYFQKLFVKLGVAPTGASMKLDVKLNGVTILTTPITISVGTTSKVINISGFSTLSFAETDLLTFDITQVGSTIPGGNDIYVSLLVEAV